VGLVLGALQGIDQLLGFKGGGRVDDQRERGFNRKVVVCLGLLSSPRLQLQTTKRKRFANLWKEISSRSSPFTWSVCKEEKEIKRETQGLGASWPKLGEL
jgi:hypothetical protein